MIKTIMRTGTLTAAFMLCNHSLAQQAPLSPSYNTMQQPYLDPAFNLAPLTFADFPTREEMARLAPPEPEPLTEDKIRQQFAQRKAQLSEALKKDRQAAEKYAQDFARYQKHQANSLVKLMAKAEKRRVKILEDLDAQQKRTLAQFRQRQPKAESGNPSSAKQ